LSRVVAKPKSPAPTGTRNSWASKQIARYRAEGDTAFSPRSRRPHTSPNAIEPRVVELTVAVRKDLGERVCTPGPTRSAGTRSTPITSPSLEPPSPAPGRQNLVNPQPNGARPVLIARTMSQIEVRVLERFPEIQKNPEASNEALVTASLTVEAGRRRESRGLSSQSLSGIQLEFAKHIRRHPPR
jgi:leucine-zipper of insertion element IS481